MRKVLVFLICIVLLLAFQFNGFLIVTQKFNGRYSVYKNNENVQIEYDLTLQQAIKEKLVSKDVSGESIKFIGDDKDIDYILDNLNVQIVEEQDFANIRTIYGYSARLGQGVKVSGNKINIQIAKRGATIIIGTPLILGSY